MRLLIAFLLSYSLYADCVYVDCSSGVSNATQQDVSRVNSKIDEISNKLDNIKELYRQKSEALQINSDLYKKIVLLKKEYLLRLKEINFELNKQKMIIKEIEK